MILIRLYFHNRRCGMSRRRAFIRAWAKTWEPDPFTAQRKS